MKTLEYLDAIKEKFGLKSDYALAKKLELTSTAVQIMRKGTSVFSDKTALKVAELLEINSAEVMIQSHVERCSDAEVKAAWEAISKMLAGKRLTRSTEENAPAITMPLLANINNEKKRLIIMSNKKLD